MSAVPVAIADAITTILNNAVQAESFESLTTIENNSLVVSRSYPDWDDDFKDLKTLAIDVVFVSSGSSGGDLVELDSEGSLSTEPAIDVAVRYRFEPTERNPRLKNESVDRLVRLVEEIYEKLAAARDTALSITGISANWIDVSVRTHCDYKRLREGVFLGVVRVRYDASRSN